MPNCTVLPQASFCRHRAAMLPICNWIPWAGTPVQFALFKQFSSPAHVRACSPAVVNDLWTLRQSTMRTRGVVSLSCSLFCACRRGQTCCWRLWTTCCSILALRMPVWRCSIMPLSPAPLLRSASWRRLPCSCPAGAANSQVGWEVPFGHTQLLSRRSKLSGGLRGKHRGAAATAAMDAGLPSCPAGAANCQVG